MMMMLAVAMAVYSFHYWIQDDVRRSIEYNTYLNGWSQSSLVKYKKALYSHMDGQKVKNSKGNSNIGMTIASTILLYS